MEVAHDPGRLEDRAAPLFGFDASVRGSTLDMDTRIEDPLARGNDVAIGARALEHERDINVGGELADMRGRGGRPDLLVRVGDKDQALERQPASFSDHRLERIEPSQQAGLHVRDARTMGDAVVEPEGTQGRRPGVEHGVEVADQQHPRATGLTRKGCHDGVAELPGRIRPVLDRGAKVVEELPGPSADLVDTHRRVAPAVDVDESLEVGEIRGEVRGDRRSEPV